MKFRIFKNYSSHIFIFLNIYYFSNLYATTLTKSIVIILCGTRRKRNWGFLEQSQLIDYFSPALKLVRACLLDL